MKEKRFPTSYGVVKGSVFPELKRSEIHVWGAWLDASQSFLEESVNCLSPDELQRALRLRFREDKDRFIAGRAVLRSIVSKYLNLPPSKVELQYGPHGKPRLTPPAGESRLEFNLSHTGDAALVAISLAREVGIDIEKIRADISFMRLAERFFHPEEAATLRSLPPENRNAAFFELWTRKEACVKAMGIGLRIPLRRIRVSLDNENPQYVHGPSHDGGKSGDWSIMPIEAPRGYAAAIAAQGRGWSVSLFEWARE